MSLANFGYTDDDDELNVEFKSMSLSRSRSPSLAMFDLGHQDIHKNAHEKPHHVDTNEYEYSGGDCMPLCKHGGKCYRRNAEHLAKYSHPPHAHQHAHSSKKQEVCHFLEEGWCHKWSHIKFPSKFAQHPPKLVRCPRLDTLDKDTASYVGCKDHACRYQHPNPANTAHQASWQPDTPKTVKLSCFYLCVVPNMTRTVCSAFALTGACTNNNCTSQHQIQVAPLYVAPNVVAQVIPAAPGAEFFVRRIWTTKQTNPAHTVVSVDEVVSPKLYAEYKKRLIEIEHRDGCEPEEIYGFHGTSAAALQTIVQSGFRADMQLHNAVGKGTYFARDPSTSVSYSSNKGSNQMLLCRLVLGKDKTDSIWYPGACYYIIPDTRGCLPRFVVTFK